MSRSQKLLDHLLERFSSEFINASWSILCISIDYNWPKLMDDLLAISPHTTFLPDSEGMCKLNVGRNKIFNDTMYYLLTRACEPGHTAAFRGLLSVREVRDYVLRWTLEICMHAMQKGRDDLVALILDAIGTYGNTETKIPFSRAVVAAVMSKNLKILRMLVDRGAPCVELDSYHESPLHLAAANGCMDIISFLLEKGAPVNCISADGHTPLHRAVVVDGNSDTVKLLIAAGANVNHQVLTEGHSHTQILSCDCGYSALHYAAQRGLTGIIAILIGNGALVDCTTVYGQTALHIAATCNHKNAVQALIDSGCKMNLENSENLTPLAYATQNRNDDAMVVLLKNGAKSDLGPEGSQLVNLVALSHWRLNRPRKRILALLTSGAALDYGCPGLLDFVEGIFNSATESEVVAMLENARHPSESKPLPKWVAAAARRGQLQTIRLLAKLGAEFDCAVGDRADTALHCAAREGHDGVVKLLVEFGVNMDACNADGDTPLHLALRGGHTDAASQLLGFGVRVDVANKVQQQPAHLAASVAGQNELLSLLLSAGAPRSPPDADGCTPLHIAASRGDLKAAQLLLDAGALVDALTHAGNLPLHLAAGNGHEPVVRILLATAADARASD
ncbi:hypothetical protein HK405_011079, partial [Cladochytrium tenue]